jgi:hypothetical protein
MPSQAIEDMPHRRPSLDRGVEQATRVQHDNPDRFVRFGPLASRSIAPAPANIRHVTAC